MSRAPRRSRRVGLALLLLAPLAGAPVHAQEERAQEPSRAQEQRPAAGPPSELTVQKAWRLLAVGLEVDRRLRVRPLLRLTERALRRELPGLEVGFERAAWRNFDLPADARPELLDNAGLVTQAVRQAEAQGLEPAAYDVFFVLTPYCREYFGISHVDVQDRDGRTVRGAVIQSQPYELLYEGLVRGLEGRPTQGFRPEVREPLSPELKTAALVLLSRGKEALRRLCEAPLVREALLAPTLAHELGHFFAPGDTDVKDGYDRGWMRHASGPEDNPERHDLECCMYKGRDARFYAQKLLASRGRLIRFCDPCREQLGLPARRRAPRRCPAWF